MIRYAALMIPFLFVGAMPSVGQSEADWEFTDGKVTVRVVDAHGQPASGIEVVSVSVDSGGLKPNSMRDAEQHRSTKITDAAGLAIFERRLRHGNLVFARSGDLGGWLGTKIHQPDNKDIEIDLPLRAPFLQSGLVRDPSGTPLESAKVWIVRSVVGAVTGPDGRYSIPSLDNFKSFLVEHEEFGLIEINNSQNHDVTLPARGRIHVRVESPDGAPVSDVTVWSHGGSGHSSGASLGGITDATGEITIDGIAAISPIRVTGQKRIDGVWMSARQELELAADGTADVVLTLLDLSVSRPTTHLSGRVIMADTGEPVQAAILMGTHKDRIGKHAGHTEADGTFRVSDLGLWDWLVWAAADDVTLRPKGGALLTAFLSGGEPDEDLVSEMERAAAVRGRALSADGIPIAGQKVRATQLLPNGTQHLRIHNPSARTNDKGEFVLASLAATGYPLELDVMGNAARIDPIAVGEITDNVEIVVEHLHLAKAEAPTYTGRLVDEAGNPITGARIQAKPLQETVTDASGQFGFRYDYKPRSVMSVHIDGEVAMEAIHVPTAASDDRTTGGRMDGAKMIFSVTRAGQILGQVAVRTEEGQDGYDPTDPIPGAVVRLTSEVEWKRTAYTRADGSFEFSAEKDGTVEFSVSNSVTHYTPLSIDSSDEPITLVEGRDLLLNADDTPTTIRLVARRANSTVVAGTIRDESGAMLEDADVRYYVRDIEGGVRGEQGRFFWGGPGIDNRAQAPDEPFLLLVRKKGYQPVLLERGRDFESGDQDIRVVLKRGPFPEGESVFTAVTGYLEERDLQFPGRSFKEQEERWASEASIPHTSKRTFRLHVLLPDGQPAETIYTQSGRPFETPGGFGPGPVSAATMLVEDSVGPQRHSGVNGWFTWEEEKWNMPPTRGIWVWAEGTARHVFTFNQETPDGESFEIALQQPGSLTIRVATYDRKPGPGFTVLPAGSYAAGSSNTMVWAPKTDAKGEFRLENLPPGQYDYRVYMPLSEDESGWQKLSPQFVSFDLTAGSDSEAKVVHGVPQSGSAEELLLQFSRKRRNRRSENEEAPAIDPGTHNRLGALVTKKLKALPGRYVWEVRESQMLISAARHFKLDGAVPALRRYFRQWPDESIGRGIVYEPYELADAIAELAGNDATQFFTNAAVSDLQRNQRTAAIMALGAIGTAESVAEFARMRDAAYGTAGAPAGLEAPSDAEAIAQAIEMTFNVLPRGESERNSERVEIRTNTIRIMDDGTARLVLNPPSGSGTFIDGGNTVVRVRRLHGEWIAVGVGSTHMS